MKSTDKEGKQMILVSIKAFDDDPAIGIARTGFTSAINLVKAQVAKIILAQSNQGIPTDGETTDKAKKFGLLCKSVFRICAAASGFASSTGNDILKAKVNFSLAQIEAKLYNGIGAFTDGILTIITPIIGSLAPFGALPAQLADCVTKLAAFRAAESGTTAAVDERKVQTGLIHPYVKEAKRLLEELCDPIADTLLEEQPDWHSLWVNARKIDHFPHGSTIAEGFLLAPDGTGIYNGDVFFPEQNIHLSTMLDGSYLRIKFPHGITTPIANADGFQPNKVSKPFEIKLGHTVKHNFNMLPV